MNPKNVSGMGVWKHRRMIRSARELAGNYLLRASLELQDRRWPWPATAPKHVIFSAALGRLLDDDSLPYALSAYRDALGDAGILGKSPGTVRGPGRVLDAPGDGHLFSYEQHVARRGEPIGVAIIVEAR